MNFTRQNPSVASAVASTVLRRLASGCFVAARMQRCSLFARVVALSVLVAGCEWVDSTGVQSSSPLIQLDSGQVVELIEGESRSLDPVAALDPERTVSLWRWSEEPVQAGALLACAAVEGFRFGLAAESVTEACVKAGDCGLQFEPQTAADGRELFRLVSPQLKASVGVTHQLTGTREDGSETSANFTFCLIAVNEAPNAVNDVFTVELGGTLSVDATDANLLSNDSDDIDVGNQPLFVVTPALREPELASSFVLGSDGGFTYTPDPDLNLGNSSRLTDSFDYEVSDGALISSASAVINIVAIDEPPLIEGPVPEVVLTAGIETIVTLADYFVDPEGAELIFSVVSGLPPSDNLFLTPEGILVGLAQAEDIGSWQIVLTVADSENAVDVIVSLTIVENLPPVADTGIPDQSIDTGDEFTFDAGRFFSDPESVDLLYSISGSDDVVINRRSGLITGSFSTADSIELTVSADDGYNDPVAEKFTLTVIGRTNRRPVYRGSIANQSIPLGTAIEVIEGDFSDPDGDELRYSISGNLPDGLEISRSSGRIFGEPDEPGQYPGIRIIASDPDGLTASSNRFSISVRDDDDDDDDDNDAQVFETTGIVSIEAERFSATLTAGDHSWVPFVDNDATNAIGMRALPDTGVRRNTPADSPELSYRVHFSGSGRMYIWVRGFGIRNGNSIHVGINGVSPDSASNISFPIQWSWSNERQGGVASLTVLSAGTHTINVWMREDGVSFDKLVLTRNPNFIPTSSGPPETLLP